MMFIFCFPAPLWLPYSQIGAQPLEFAPMQLFRVQPWQAYLPLGAGPWPSLGVLQVAAPSTALSRGSSCYSLSCPPAAQHDRAQSFGGLGESHPILSTFPT